MSGPARRLPHVALGLLALLALWEVAALRAASASIPDDGEWRAAARLVRDGWRPGDLVVFAPAWIDPVGRRHLGDLLALEDVGRMDAARYPRIWELSIRGAARTELAALPVAFDRAAGRVRVRRVEQDAPEVTWDTRRRGRLCDVDGHPRWGPRIELRDRPKHLDLRTVPLGTALHVRAGLAGPFARRVNRARARVAVLVDGEERAHAWVDASTGWTALPVVATVPGPHRVAILATVDGPGRPAHLDLCIAAESRRAR